MSKPYVIFAPHPDDEIIGCWRLLQDGFVSHVYYFSELTAERRLEALTVSRNFGFIPIFVQNGSHKDALKVPSDSIILVPSVYDKHPDHAKVRSFGKTFDNVVEFYSTDMNHKFDVLSFSDRYLKEKALKEYYPSQSKLFENEKYFLFEYQTADESSKMIWVTFQQHGLHRYPAAETNIGLDDVSYLANVHRHLFKFKVSIEVWHDDRDIEFHQFQNWLMSLYENGERLDYKSCEMISDALAKIIQVKYPGRKLIIEVSEDGENGSIVEYPA